MYLLTDNSVMQLGRLMLVLVTVCFPVASQTQASPSGSKSGAQLPEQQTVPHEPAVVPPSAQPAPEGTVIDSVVAVVNGDVILESDVDEERRFEAIQPYRGSLTEFSRDRAIQRIVDRTLLLQQAALEPDDTDVNDEDLDRQIATLRKDVAECKQYQCETDAGWAKYLAANGFTVAGFRERWRRRMELLRLIDIRFRNGIHISDDEIKNYYEKTMLPEYARRKVPPPKLETIANRIEEVLLQQQVGNLLVDWLRSLRAQGSVWVAKPGEVAP